MTKTLPFSDRFMQVMEEHKADFYANPFIQAMIAGEVHPKALLYYVQQDYRYLGHYLPLYEQVCQTLTGQTIDAEVVDDHREYTAHKILLDLAQTDDKSIQEGKYPNSMVTDQYVNHMVKSVEKDPFIGLVALAACPYDYAYLADLLIRDGLIKPDNPFMPWVGYYRGIDKGLTRPMLALVNQTAEQVSPEVQEEALAAFIQSTKYENQFFLQGMEATK
ncbi:TenA family protein [Fructobacillus evanidus]|uniref:Aminopyrimidine aminohydrolase n=1 Tax=Fructobacillus evanidus TaxID=3064281 RepID=A0ABN9YVA1_9LACO|nr:Aminopyrimidine aminohydrolase TenA (thiamine salvage pathway) (TenA) [Fructobacillus sp. LMG 32999]CAK1230215.1 Aminopyrimidine aminohydrolase TenA (thiamine salvage pathway) (TenA) [Fructobacillus sp. LMG 32999]CAK1232987.1 Aminopyrimidine aminohydrolase TenA (thiamine salvage pathway) (TenA) [Fructobacillus sp. LMG 32999]CAK1233179.1 Aminopyrimidine aminohydrolase TenA (thiamine salvage pathway) (TenA) [Fructobacillus sp. LMG 32999]CAK1234276.1 Aminopyrimidine aminohydrolase TenA (thiamin